MGCGGGDRFNDGSLHSASATATVCKDILEYPLECCSIRGARQRTQAETTACHCQVCTASGRPGRSRLPRASTSGRTGWPFPPTVPLAIADNTVVPLHLLPRFSYSCSNQDRGVRRVTAPEIIMITP